MPTNQDILHCRKATKGISEIKIIINNVPFLFVDVGGQRSQRQKWFRCFDSVTSILFLISSSEFDQVLVEDRYIFKKNLFDFTVKNSSYDKSLICIFKINFDYILK